MRRGSSFELAGTKRGGLAARIATIVLASASPLALSTAARAQQPYNWSGFYVGVNAGFARGHSNVATGVPCTATSVLIGYLCTTTNPGYAPDVSATGTGSAGDTGFTGGVQAGFNWQANNLVYGLEADFGTFSVNTSRSVTALYGAGPQTDTIRNQLDTDWLLTLRGRFGWAFSDMLVYGTGGLAVTKISIANTYRDTSVFDFLTGDSNASDTKIGWVIGAGVEWALGKNWTVKAEYLRVDFGSVDASGIISAPTFTYAQGIDTSIDLTAHIARVGVNFKF